MATLQRKAKLCLFMKLLVIPLLFKENYANTVCDNNFPLSELQQDMPYRVVNGRQYIFPEIEFTCTANITKWIYFGRLGIQQPAKATDLPEFQVWERSGGNYILQSSTGIDAVELPMQSNEQGHIECILRNPIPVVPGQVVGLLARSRLSPLSSVDVYFLEIPNQHRYYFTNTNSYQSIYNAQSNPNGNRYVPQLSVELCYPGTICSTSSVSSTSASTTSSATSAAVTTSSIMTSSTTSAAVTTSSIMTSSTTSAAVTTSSIMTSSTTSTATSTTSSSSTLSITSTSSPLTTPATTSAVATTSTAAAGTILATTPVTSSAVVSSFATATSSPIPEAEPTLSTRITGTNIGATNGYDTAGKAVDIFSFFTPLVISINVGMAVLATIILFFLTIIICILLHKLKRKFPTQTPPVHKSASTAELRYIKHNSERAADSMCTNLAYNDVSTELYDIISSHAQNNVIRREQSEPIDIIGPGNPHVYSVPQPLVTTPTNEQPHSYEVPSSTLPRGNSHGLQSLVNGIYAIPSLASSNNIPSGNELYPDVIQIEMNQAYRPSC